MPPSIATAERPTPRRVMDRACTHIRIEGECWLSTYSLTNAGYPQIGWHEGAQRYGRLVHRIIWEAVYGSIPAEMTVDHMRTVCIGPPCVRPDHLRLLSNFDNAQRNNGKDWPLGECANGHPNSERVRFGKQTWCGVCRREYYQEWANRPESKAKIAARQRRYQARLKAKREG